MDTIAAGLHWVDVACPRCGSMEIIAVNLAGLLQVPTDDAPSLRIKAKSKPVDHSCGQTSLTSADLFGTEAKP